MSVNIRHFIIRYIKPAIWKINPARKPYFLQDFSLLELDSAWQSLNAISKVKNKELKVSLFKHSLEEFYHFELFRGLSKKYSTNHLVTPVLKREYLLKDPELQENLVEFLTYLHVGEKEVNSDFYAYALSAKQDVAIQDAFFRIKQDEEHHEHDTLAWIKNEFNISNWTLNFWIIRHTISRSWKTYKLSMQLIGKIPLTVFLTINYFTLGAISSFFTKKRMKFTRSEELKVFKSSLIANKEIIKKKLKR